MNKQHAMDRSAKTKKFVFLSILTAFTILFSLPGVSVTALQLVLTCIPVSIAAIFLGVKYSFILGTVFGLSSFMQAFGLSAFGVMMMEISPIETFLVCVPTRMLMGLLTGLLAKLLLKSKLPRRVGHLIVTLTSSVLNTALFCGVLAIFFGSVNLDPSAEGINSIMKIVIIPTVTFNGIFEALLVMVLGTAIAEAITQYLRIQTKKAH